MYGRHYLDRGACQSQFLHTQLRLSSLHWVTYQCGSSKIQAPTHHFVSWPRQCPRSCITKSAELSGRAGLPPGESLPAIGTLLKMGASSAPPAHDTVGQSLSCASRSASLFSCHSRASFAPSDHFGFWLRNDGSGADLSMAASFRYRRNSSA